PTPPPFPYTTLFRSTTSVVESSSHDAVVPLWRGRPRKPASFDTAVLRDRIALGARYLARMTGTDGKLVYLYDIAADREVDDEYRSEEHTSELQSRGH